MSHCLIIFLIVLCYLFESILICFPAYFDFSFLSHPLIAFTLHTNTHPTDPISCRLPAVDLALAAVRACCPSQSLAA